MKYYLCTGFIYDRHHQWVSEISPFQSLIVLNVEGKTHQRMVTLSSFQEISQEDFEMAKNMMNHGVWMECVNQWQWDRIKDKNNESRN